ncbi:hypothetical protein, partial [Neisseria meningitidis]|uniref:hypothetical protein n=2 Tax=Neisseria meningitidis TaxID=487 RepID=UPI0019810B26
VLHFENEIEHKILVTYVIAKVSGRILINLNRCTSSNIVDSQKPVQRCLALPYYLYCLRLRRLVLIFVNPL